MYILNVDDIPEHKLYRCNKSTAKWLQSKNIPLMGKSDTGEYIFSNTELLREILESKPFLLGVLDLLYNGR